jgi:hypothetical protein
MNIELTKNELDQLIDGIWAARDTHYTDEGIMQYDALLAKLCAALAEAE